MSEWRGLHNPESHTTDCLTGEIAQCSHCVEAGGLCHPSSPCRCCLAAEVEALRATVQRVREECEDPWFFDVGEHAGETPEGLPFVEKAAVLKALDGDA